MYSSCISCYSKSPSYYLLIHISSYLFTILISLCHVRSFLKCQWPLLVYIFLGATQKCWLEVLGMGVKQGLSTSVCQWEVIRWPAALLSECGQKSVPARIFSVVVPVFQGWSLSTLPWEVSARLLSSGIGYCSTRRPVLRPSICCPRPQLPISPYLPFPLASLVPFYQSH